MGIKESTEYFEAFECGCLPCRRNEQEELGRPKGDSLSEHLKVIYQDTHAALHGGDEA